MKLKFSKDRVLVIVFTIILVVGCLGSINRYYDALIGKLVVSNEGFKANGDFATNVNAVFPFRNEILNVYGAFSNVLGKRAMNGVIKLDNGYLSELIPESDDTSIRRGADYMVQLSEYLKQKDIEFLYVQAPYKISKYDSALPAGLYDYSNENTDKFLEYLDANDVHYIDIRKEMYEDGLNQYDYFYRTDHHMNVYGGFYTFQKIYNEVGNILNVQVENQATDINNYTQYEKENWFLGYRGRTAGAGYSGYDDFAYLIPEFDTNIIKADSEKEGSFEEVLVDSSMLEDRKLSYSVYGACSAGEFLNEEAESKTRILIGGDSFTLMINPFMICAYSEVQTSWRHPAFTKEMLDEYEPDIVILVNYAGIVPNKYGYVEGITK